MVFVLKRYISEGYVIAIGTFMGFLCVIFLFRRNSKKYLVAESKKKETRKAAAANEKNKQFVEQELGYKLPEDAKANIIFVNTNPSTPPSRDLTPRVIPKERLDQKKRYKNTRKATLKDCKIDPCKWEETAIDLSAWRQQGGVKKGGVTQFKADRITEQKRKREVIERFKAQQA